MKKTFLSAIPLLMLILSSSAFPETDTPPKTITLKRILTISDPGESSTSEWTLRYPEKIASDAHHNIYVLDYNRLWKFNARGAFVNGMLSEGQGPGEVTSVSHFFVDRDQIVLHNNNPSKIIILSTDGALIREFRVAGSEYLTLAHRSGDQYYFFSSGIPEINGEQGCADAPETLWRVRDEGKTVEKIAAFPVQKYVVNYQGARSAFDIGTLLFAPRNNREFLISHSRDYRIIRYNPETRVETGILRSPFQKQRTPETQKNKPGGMAMLNGKVFKAPPREYLNDIQQLFVRKNTVWAVTSQTGTDGKSVRVDIYNLDNGMVETAFLAPEGISDIHDCRWTLTESFLYAIEKNKDDTPLIVKYQIQ